MKLFRNPRRSAAIVIGVAAVVALAACGSSSKAATVTPGAQPGASSSTAPGATPTTGGGSAPVVATASTTKLGSVLVDSKGMTLYTLTNAGAAVPCTGQCPTFWPPLLLTSGATTATGADGVTGLGTAPAGSDTQVTHAGLPLYTFSKDTAPGDTNGEGLASFGGVWHVVKASASASASSDTTVAPAPPVAPVTTAPSGGYNSGY